MQVCKIHVVYLSWLFCTTISCGAALEWRSTLSWYIHICFTSNVLQHQFLSEWILFFFSWTSRWLSFFQKYIKILRIYHLLLWMTCFSDSSFPLFKNKACNYCLNTFECICLSLVLVVMSEFSFTSDCLKNFICPFDTVVSPSVSS